MSSTHRALHFCAALCAALWACKSAAGERRGEVVEVSGEVTAQRGDSDPRPLAAGDPVTGEDRIRTGEGAEVKIRLAHNGVLVVLSSGADVLLAEQAGWKASGEVGRGVLERDPDDKTAAAGVNSEREAATDPNAVLANDTESADNAETEDTAAEPDPGSDGVKPDDGDDRGTGATGKKTGGGQGGAGNRDDKTGLPQPEVAIQVEVSGDAELAGHARRILGRLGARLRACSSSLSFEATLRFAGGSVELADLSGVGAKERLCVTRAFAGLEVSDRLEGSVKISIAPKPGP
jgi:hypothetical protein